MISVSLSIILVLLSSSTATSQNIRGLFYQNRLDLSNIFTATFESQPYEAFDLVLRNMDKNPNCLLELSRHPILYIECPVDAEQKFNLLIRTKTFKQQNFLRHTEMVNVKERLLSFIITCPAMAKLILFIYRIQVDYSLLSCGVKLGQSSLFFQNFKQVLQNIPVTLDTIDFIHSIGNQLLNEHGNVFLDMAIELYSSGCITADLIETYLSSRRYPIDSKRSFLRYVALHKCEFTHNGFLIVLGLDCSKELEVLISSYPDLALKYSDIGDWNRNSEYHVSNLPVFAKNLQILTACGYSMVDFAAHVAALEIKHAASETRIINFARTIHPLGVNYLERIKGALESVRGPASLFQYGVLAGLQIILILLLCRSSAGLNSHFNVLPREIFYHISVKILNLTNNNAYNYP